VFICLLRNSHLQLSTLDNPLSSTDIYMLHYLVHLRLLWRIYNLLLEASPLCQYIDETFGCLKSAHSLQKGIKFMIFCLLVCITSWISLSTSGNNTAGNAGSILDIPSAFPCSGPDLREICDLCEL